MSSQAWFIQSQPKHHTGPDTRLKLLTMQPTEIFAQTVRTGIPASKDPKIQNTQQTSTTEHASRDMVRVEIKLLLQWASNQLDNITISGKNSN